MLRLERQGKRQVMEKQINEMQFDEFEKLLGEIPSATSGNQNHEDSFAMTKGRQTKRAQEEEETEKDDERQEANLPDDQSILTSAFAELSYNDGAAAVMGPTPLINYNNAASFQDHSVLLDGRYAGAANANNPLKKLHQNVADPRFMLVRSPDVDELKKIDYCQIPVDDFSGGVPLALSGVQGLHLVSNVAPPVECPEQQQQFYLNAQSPIPYIHHNPQQLNRPMQMTWREMDHEQYYYKMHQQYLYLQQQQQQQQQLVLRNQQQFEGRILQVQENGNNAATSAVSSPNQLMNRAQEKTNTQIMPISRHIERYNQGQHQHSCWDEAPTISRSSKQAGPAKIPPLNHHNTVLQHLHQNFPEKILTRSNGINSLKSVKFGSFIGTAEQQPLLANSNNNNFNNQNGRFVVPNVGYCSLSDPIVGFQFDSLSSKGSSPDMVDLKQHQHNNTNETVGNNTNNVNNSLRPMLQRCGSIDEYIGRIYIMAKDQHGCRFLQRKFAEGTAEDVKKIFVEIIVHIAELMTDPFGNYLVQKLLEVCDTDQQMQILHSITRRTGDLVRISCDMHGTRAVQKVIETLKTPEQVSLVVSSLKPGIVTLIKNMNGNHVAQRCLQYLSPQYSEFLFEAATANCVELATDRHGCCVLQKCLSHSEGEQRRRLVSQVTSNSLILSQDPFGNYVVQYVFEINLGWATEDILDQLQGNYGDLSMQKYSSNVVEKCLKYAGEERRRSIMQEILSNPHLDQIMQDPYGNYVIQAALNLSKGSLHSTLVEAIRNHVPVLRTSPYGKKVLSSNSLKK